MGVTVRLDEARWQAHLAEVVADAESIVPVVKGHGYGFGLVRLAAECRRRAVVCETYTAALASHHRALAVLDGADPQRRARVAAVPPPCPEPWVTPD